MKSISCIYVSSLSNVVGMASLLVFIDYCTVQKSGDLSIASASETHATSSL